MRPTKEKAADIVKPLVSAPGETHLLKKIFDGPADKMPTLKSVGYAQLAPGNQWVSYVLTTKGKEVLSIEVDEPNLRQIAEESAKISFVSELVDREIE